MGGSSSTTSQKTEIPAYLEEASKFALEKAKQIDALGKLPYMGPEVAAVNPFEQALARNVGGMASAFGLEAPAALDMGGMETVTQGGLTGYSSYPAYMASMERLKELRPDQYEYFAKMTGFDPITGVSVAPPPAPVAAPVAAPTSSAAGSSNDDDPLELHYSIFPETRPTTGPYAAPRPSLVTGRPTDASRSVFSTADLMGNHGGSYSSKITSDIEKLPGGGLFALEMRFQK